jgi:hypothetical protein
MAPKLTPHSNLESLRKEAKRWLKALQAGDPHVSWLLEHGANADAVNSYSKVPVISMWYSQATRTSSTCWFAMARTGLFFLAQNLSLLRQCKATPLRCDNSHRVIRNICGDPKQCSP